MSMRIRLGWKRLGEAPIGPVWKLGLQWKPDSEKQALETTQRREEGSAAETNTFLEERPGPHTPVRKRCCVNGTSVWMAHRRTGN